MADYEKFKEMYAAYFHRLTPADGEQFWAEFVEKCDAALLREAVERLAEVDTMRKAEGKLMVAAPKLDAVKACYWRMKFQRDEQARSALLGRTVCGFCEGHGAVIVLMHNRMIIDPHHPPVAPYPALAWYVFPCICPFGEHKSGEIETPRQQREKAVKFHIPWTIKTKDGSWKYGDDLAWLIVWDCDRKYQEQAKRVEVIPAEVFERWNDKKKKRYGPEEAAGAVSIGEVLNF